MPALILDGRKTREELTPGLTARIKALSFTPKLAIIQVGSRPDSSSYIRGKIAFAQKIGAGQKLIQLDEKVTESEIIKTVQECNADASIQGIIVQLPLPKNINQDAVINSIDPCKDVDGLTATNVKLWLENDKSAILPATAKGVMTLFASYNIELAGKNVVVIGRSALVGKPIAAACMNKKASVTVCHSQTPDITVFTKQADIIIIASGKPGLLRKEHVKAGQVIIDVGISKTVTGDLVGDVDFAEVSKIVKAITPVPGGVGPMTVYSLFENLVEMCEK